ncbi:UNVERIFIED_CONTAM: protein dehydration-induced [Sesamum calycinum]|uniref:Protein dehydration-induced n=1 Tax=Sesamum calycinum TaxID=2727403 RepID=A0AAW2QK99_9LAMI
MDPRSWARMYSSARRYQSRSDVYRGDEFEEEEETRPEFLCPFCAEDFDMVGLCCHIDEEHAAEAKNGEGKLQSLLSGSSLSIPSSHAEPDPLLNSFIYNPSLVDEPLTVKHVSSIEACSVAGSAVESLADRAVEERKLSEEEQKEKAQRCEFVQGLLLSTFLDDNL